MVNAPWRTRVSLDPDREYWAVATSLHVRGIHRLGKFFRYTRRIGEQLERQQGFVGFALRTNIPRMRFWTFTVWEDGPSARAFVNEGAHAEAIRELRPALKKFGMTRWRAAGSSLPPPWTIILKRLDDAGQNV